jgi:hypothetical protein
MSNSFTLREYTVPPRRETRFLLGFSNKSAINPVISDDMHKSPLIYPGVVLRAEMLQSLSLAMAVLAHSGVVSCCDAVGGQAGAGQSIPGGVAPRAAIASPPVKSSPGHAWLAMRALPRHASQVST